MLEKFRPSGARDDPIAVESLNAAGTQQTTPQHGTWHPFAPPGAPGCVRPSSQSPPCPACAAIGGQCALTVPGNASKSAIAPRVSSARDISNPERCPQ